MGIEVAVQFRISTVKDDDGNAERVVVWAEDALSGETLLGATLTPGEFWNVCAGASVDIDAQTTEDWERVGFPMSYEEFPVPKKVLENAAKNSMAPTVAVGEWFALTPTFTAVHEFEFEERDGGEWFVLTRYWEGAYEWEEDEDDEQVA